MRHLLENSALKIGCVVNDVANVNIDAKLIRGDRNKDRENGLNTTTDLADTIELANGCACEFSAPDVLLSESMQSLVDVLNAQLKKSHVQVCENVIRRLQHSRRAICLLWTAFELG